MITYVVCLYRPDVYARVCQPALALQEQRYGAKIVLVGSDVGLCHAYEIGRNEALHETVVYLHDDVELLDDDATERILSIMDESGAALMGVVGSAAGERKLPWWDARANVGSWCWANRQGARMFQREHGAPNSEPWTGQRSTAGTFAAAQCLDGILLADRTNLPWPEMPGWHGYDVDRCMAAREVGPVVAGDLMVCHHGQPHDAAWQDGIATAMQAMREKWGME